MRHPNPFPPGVTRPGAPRRRHLPTRARVGDPAGDVVASTVVVVVVVVRTPTRVGAPEQRTVADVLTVRRPPGRHVERRRRRRFALALGLVGVMACGCTPGRTTGAHPPAVTPAPVDAARRPAAQADHRVVDPAWKPRAPRFTPPPRPLPRLGPRATTTRGTPDAVPGCSHRYPGPTVSVGVAVARRSATLRWRHDAHPSIVRYRVAAVPHPLVPGPQAPLTWRTVKAPAGCGTLSTTVSGLRPRTSYEFWVEAVVTSPVTGRTTQPMIGRSAPVTTR